MDKPNVLFVADHPEGFTGNGHMMSALLERIDYTKINVSVFTTQAGVQADAFKKREYHLIEGGLDPNDYFGSSQLLNTIHQSPVDVLMFIGLDLWKYAGIYNHLIDLKKEKKFVWVSLFPYDFSYFRHDWLEWLSPVDLPLVYSQYGYDVLKEHCDRIKYFRPPLYDADKFIPYSDMLRKEKRESIFKLIGEETFLFGFFGVNQVRKDPMRLVNSFFKLRNEIPNISLYMHTEVGNGVFNLEDYLKQMGSVSGDVFIKKRKSVCLTGALVDLYNICDCLVNTSLQEGLSWTLLEAMLCGVPVIAADNTSQSELIAEGAGLPVACTDLAFIPITLPSGLIQIEARACNQASLEGAMSRIVNDKALRQGLIEKGFERAKEWLAGVSDINEVLLEAAASKKTTITLKAKEKKILFVQHSSAGDVLMSTQCFKGIKERHKGMPLVYMTQPQYQDIVTNNPYIDEIIDYNSDLFRNYQIVYNPHGDKILTGGWNNLDVTLHSMYPYFCKVTADDIYIEEVNPNIELPEKYIVVHSTGGNVEYRSYAHLNAVVPKLPCPTVQVGGLGDRKVVGAIDLRSKLSFRQTAYVMKRAQAAIVIDSFPAHLAGALGTPVVVLFGPAPARVTRPRGDEKKIICLEPNMLDVCNILSHCWSTPPSGKRKCMSPCINTISPVKVISAVKQLLEDK